MRLPIAFLRRFFTAGRAIAQSGTVSGRSCFINNEGVYMPRWHVGSLSHFNGSIGGNAGAFLFTTPQTRYTSL